MLHALHVCQSSSIFVVSLSSPSSIKIEQRPVDHHGRVIELFSNLPKPQAEAEADDELDEHAIPRQATWSVHELISSYPRPKISNATFKKLHELSALVPPEEDTQEHAKMKRELEEMVKLVEAVKFVDTSELEEAAGKMDENGVRIPDGRIWPESEGMVMSKNSVVEEFDGEIGGTGLELLKYATRAKDGLYVVEADRRKKK